MRRIKIDPRTLPHHKGQQQEVIAAQTGPLSEFLAQTTDPTDDRLVVEDSSLTLNEALRIKREAEIAIADTLRDLQKRTGLLPARVVLQHNETLGYRNARLTSVEIDIGLTVNPRLR